MVIDATRYVNSFDEEVNMMSSTVRCNPREAKIWSYNVTDTGVFTVPKPFSLTIICSSDANHKGEYYANQVVEKLSKDVSYSRCGFLEINGWRLDCFFIGVSSIETDLYGVVKFTANFYAPNGFMWYKIIASRVTLPSSSGWNSSIYVERANSNCIVASKLIIKPFDNLENQLPLAIKWNMSKNQQNINKVNFYSSIAPGASNYNKYFCIDSFRNRVTIAAGPNTNVVQKNGDYMISSESDAIDKIRITSDAHYYLPPKGKGIGIYIENSRQFAYESYSYVVFYELRGMPEWKTT